MTDYAALLGDTERVIEGMEALLTLKSEIKLSAFDQLRSANIVALLRKHNAALREVMAELAREKQAYADLARLFDKRAQEHEDSMSERGA